MLRIDSSHLCVTKPKQPQLGLHTCLKVCHAKEMLAWARTDNLWMDPCHTVPKHILCSHWLCWMSRRPSCPPPPWHHGTTVVGCHGCLQQPWWSMGSLTPKRGIVHSSSPNYSLEHQNPFKLTPGIKIMFSSVCVAIKAHSKSTNRRNSCMEPGTCKLPSTELHWTHFPFCPRYKLAAPYRSCC